MAETTGSQASDAAGKAAQDAANAAKAASQDVQKAAGDVADAAKDVAKAASETASQAAGDTAEAAKGAADAAQKTAADAASKAASTIKPAGASSIKPAGASSIKPAGASSIKPAGASSIKPAAGAAVAAGAATGAAAGATVGAAAAAPKPAAAPAAKPTAKEEAAPPAPPKGVTRREFLNYVWGASMALFLAQFGGITWFFSMPRFREGEFGGVVRMPASAIPANNAAPVSNNAGKFWLVQTDQGVNALYRICTHLGCIYPWSDSAQIFACPCHGSQFELNGAWIAGPAARSLDVFAFEILDANNNVLATSPDDGSAIPLPAGAEFIAVNTGRKILGKSHF
jgi:cytochrome b6-f complex iron-sulfur subunit